MKPSIGNTVSCMGSGFYVVSLHAYRFSDFIHYNLRKCIEPKKETNCSFDPRYALKFPAQFLLVQHGTPG